MKNKITESELTRADANAVFKGAVQLRNKPSGFGRVFKSLRQPQLSLDDLQQSWKEDNYSDDTADIKRILLDHGFKKQEINKVFAEVFGQDDDSTDDHNEPMSSPAVQELANFIIKSGLTGEIKQFLEAEYKFTESVRFPKKAVIEEIRQIFTKIVNEERHGREELIRTQEKTQLGRTRK